MKVTIFWFRRDLRFEDNTGLYTALSTNNNILPLFIFDDNILTELPENDPRVSFIYNSLLKLNQRLQENYSSILIKKGKPEEVWKELIETYSIEAVYVNKDYEPYAIQRDQEITQLLKLNGIEFRKFKDQVIHEEAEVVKSDGTPYTVFTPYKNRWLDIYKPVQVKEGINFDQFDHHNHDFPTLEAIGFKSSNISVKPYNLKNITDYENNRDFPNLDSTSFLGPHLRFGTVSIRQVITQLKERDKVFLSELIWREFFTQILFHFPKVVAQNFRNKYDRIQWLNSQSDFNKWCKGETGYPMVDAGMRQLNQTGYMHNRARMVAGSFLCKHLLIDWRWGEAYFAKKLLDYELASNNGNWQWVAGTGCDAAPYFRIFNPTTQLKRFDPSEEYVKKWLPEYKTSYYPKPMVEHKFARIRALERYKSGIEN